MIYCPCCSDQLLRHTRDGAVYLFCRTCWSEMPNLKVQLTARSTLAKRRKVAS